jgi:hypothetical protein
MKKLLLVLTLMLFASRAYPLQLRFLGGVTFSKSSEPLGGAWIPEVSPRAASLTGVLAGGGVEFSLVPYVNL